MQARKKIKKKKIIAQFFKLSYWNIDKEQKY